MGIKNVITKAGNKAANKVAQLSALSADQVNAVQEQRENYLNEMPNPNDPEAQELTMRLLASCGVEIYNAYLPQINELYVPIERNVETEGEFDANHNIRYFNITKWVTDKKENNLEKLVNVYEVLSNDDCNIALIFHRTKIESQVYLAVTNTQNAKDNVKVNHYRDRLAGAIKGNFPGAEFTKDGEGEVPCLNNEIPYSVACTSNIPTEKSEKFISQTIEKLLDGIIPETEEQEYTIILLATPINDVEERKLRLAELYSGLAPYASWSTDFRVEDSTSTGSSATFGVNVGASAGIQNGQNSAVTNTNGETDSTGESITDSTGESVSDTTGVTNSDTTGETITDTEGTTESTGSTHTDGTNASSTDTKGSSDSAGASFVASYNHGWNESTAEMTGTSASDATTQSMAKNIAQSVAKNTAKTVATNTAKTVATSTGHAIANTLGKAVSNSVAKTAGVFSSVNYGINFGANFARTSSVTATIGKNEGITQNHINYSIKHTLDILEEQMKRYEQSTALGMWDFAAYVLSEDQDVANNVAHSYLALTQGEESYMSSSAINLWRGDVEKISAATKEICGYLRELRHPLFCLKPALVESAPIYNVYPSIVSATTSLSGKELAYSLNFPQKSISGLPVIECAEFGRNIVSYDLDKRTEDIQMGKIFHMNHEEKIDVRLSKQSLASHTFITGSTGSGKSNTVYQILNEAEQNNIRYLVIEPAKGEYKNVFGNDKDVLVYGTNPKLTPLLRINPFSFPSEIHVLEHMDRLIEIFNVCWPMYAAMPAVLKNAVEKSYEDCGWDLVKSVNIYGEKLYPTFADITKNIREIIDSSEYDNENKGAYKGSLITRLQSLSNGINGLIFSTDEIPASDLFEKNVIVDLSRVGSSETKTLIMGMLVLKLQEYRIVSANGINEPIKHITVLEEAHNLLRRTSTEQSQEGSNLAGKSVEMLSNAIAEMRTYGEGFVIVDQAPGLMDMSVIRNTNTKIIMRLPDQSDRELVGLAANLDEDQIKELAKLPCGVAAIYQNEWVQPILCKVKKVNVTEIPYSHTPKESDFDKTTEIITESLLDCIMNREILRKGRKADVFKLRGMIIKSKLDTTVKKDFLEYISEQGENAIEKLRKLVYDFLDAENALKESDKITDVNEWITKVVNKLDPSVTKYSNKQIDLVIALILQEQAIRDASYENLYSRFTEIYLAEGGVY